MTGLDHGGDRTEQYFIAAIEALAAGGLVAIGGQGLADRPVRAGSALMAARCLELFDAQLASRHLDAAARWLRGRGTGYYTIGSAGHESNAGVAAALRLTDPALLHYRSGAFYLVRSDQADRGQAGVRDVLLGLTGSADEPIAGGRHKVFGHPELNIIPQTSTIASHLPRAVGLAFALPRAARLGVATQWPADSVVACSFGDASANHSTAAGALNTAAYCAYQGLPLPLLLICEDNGLGISVRTPPGWAAASLSGRPSIGYYRADGTDLAGVYDSALAAATAVRDRQAPAVLHLSTVRFGGHAGSDVEAGYRTPAEVAADLRRDPLLGTARLLIEAGVLTPEQVLGRYAESRERVLALAAEVEGSPGLESAAQIMAPLAPHRPAAIAADVAVLASLTDLADLDSLDPAEARGPRQAHAYRSRQAQSGQRLGAGEGPLTLAQSINRALADQLAARPEMLVFGEDVARKGGVYGVTRGLLAGFGAGRVFDTLLDEQSILGLALGAGVAGLLPVPEIQYLAYLHNAADQIRGEAATLSFFSQGQYRNPMVLRLPGLAYQQGFGGHFHNDNAIAALRDIPGLIIACPARPDDAAPMLRTVLAAAKQDGSVCVFLEPIALYHERDLYQAGDGGWLAGAGQPSLSAGQPSLSAGQPSLSAGQPLPSAGQPLPSAGQPLLSAGHIPVGQARVYGDGTDLTIVTFGNGLRMSLRAAAKLAAAGIGYRVVDLRWLAPLPVPDLLREARATGSVLVADETRKTGGVSEGIVTALVDAGFAGAIRRVTSEDSFVPLGDAAYAVLLSENAIYTAALDLLR
jgi:2-oxoisovalerate dehydrogenase E1 component